MFLFFQIAFWDAESPQVSNWVLLKVFNTRRLPCSKEEPNYEWMSIWTRIGRNQGLTTTGVTAADRSWLAILAHQPKHYKFSHGSRRTITIWDTLHRVKVSAKAYLIYGDWTSSIASFEHHHYNFRPSIQRSEIERLFHRCSI